MSNRNAAETGTCSNINIHLGDVEGAILLAAEKPRPVYLEDGLATVW
jgi:hypothetical protein